MKRTAVYSIGCYMTRNSVIFAEFCVCCVLVTKAYNFTEWKRKRNRAQILAFSTENKTANHGKVTNHGLRQNKPLSRRAFYIQRCKGKHFFLADKIFSQKSSFVLRRSRTSTDSAGSSGTAAGRCQSVCLPRSPSCPPSGFSLSLP